MTLYHLYRHTHTYHLPLYIWEHTLLYRMVMEIGFPSHLVSSPSRPGEEGRGRGLTWEVEETFLTIYIYSSFPPFPLKRCLVGRGRGPLPSPSLPSLSLFSSLETYSPFYLGLTLLSSLLSHSSHMVSHSLWFICIFDTLTHTSHLYRMEGEGGGPGLLSPWRHGVMGVWKGAYLWRREGRLPYTYTPLLPILFLSSL